VRMNIFLHLIIAASIGLLIGAIGLPKEYYIWTTAGGNCLLFLWAGLFLFFGTKSKFVIFEIILGCLVMMVTGRAFIRTVIYVFEHKTEHDESALAIIISCFLYFVMLSVILCPLLSEWWQKRRKDEVLSQE